MKHIEIFIITIISAILIFFKIGNTSAPESFYEMTDNNPEIVLDLGDYISIKEIGMYLGPINDRRFSLSTFDEANNEWEIINSEASAVSVFDWNNLLDTPREIRYIGLVLTDNEASIGELLIVDTDDSIILPVNFVEYPELFDEQEKCSYPHTYRDGTFFDEIYHGRTAYEFTHHITPYETVHPHLGKLIMSLGVRIFGMTPFGWRFMSALFGVMIIPLMYAFALLIFNGNRLSSLFCASLLALDFMHYTLSRIATIDSIAAFFILASYFGMYGFIKYEKYLYLIISSLAISCAISTKWTGLYAGFGLAIIFFIYLFKKCTLDKKRLFVYCVLLFIVLPIIAYVAGYIPVVDGTDNNAIQKAIYAGKNMFSYHAGLDATHPYGSRWFEWPIITRPILYALDAITEDKISTISLLGNPLIYWIGIPCLIAAILGYLKENEATNVLLIGYLTSYLPWVFISRVVFLYHYYPASIFMIMIIGCTMDTIVNKYKYGKAICIGFLFLCAMAFVVYFPVVSGFPMSRAYGLALQLFDSWVFSY